jgi:SpoVK/Ycf46/Vps4 family AAA+-type ATPase
VPAQYFENTIQHILAELERIDVLIRLQVLRSRELHKADSEFQGLYISEQEVDTLLSRPAGMPKWAAATPRRSSADFQAAFSQLEMDIAQRKGESVKRGINLRLVEIANLFQLTPFEVDALLICLASELDLCYERLYAYLQDDVTKKRPSVDLVLNLLCPDIEAKLTARTRFTAGASLIKYYLVHLFDDPSHQKPPTLGKFLKVDDRVVNYLLDSDEPDTILLPYLRIVTPEIRLADMLLPSDIKRSLALTVRRQDTNQQDLIFYFQGSYGVGKQSTAEALCRELGLNLLCIDLERLANAPDVAFDKALRLAQREVLMQNAALYLSGFDSLLADDKRMLLNVLLNELEKGCRLIFLAGKAVWEPADALHNASFVRIEFVPPAYGERLEMWKRFIDGRNRSENELDLTVIANKFRFSGGQIQDAVATARNLARWRDPENGHLTMAELYTACRLQSNRKLATLAQKITPHYRWEDIVLPRDRLQQMREICNSVTYHALVYDQWGFDRKLSLGKGLNVLFAGPSGTGKTMAAEIMAAELGLDLYKIDLSTVVSKYIGETEKNLSRIFAEAQTSNAILFFDEADALFGKRSEVRDAHDRYANIEISYLLQKMEEYEGVVILATNLRKNMDDAFLRRMHFSVEFPFPTEKYRRRIWEGIWPQDTPLSPELDLDFLARRFEIAGGSIRNIALAAAFLAAGDGKVIDISHLIRATQREYQKVGKLSVGEDFGEYHHLLTREV